MNPCLERLSAQLEQSGADYEVLEHPQAFSAQREAAASHVPGMNFAKCVMVMAGPRPYLLVLPAPKYVDLETAGKTLGKKQVRLASEDEMGPLFPDCEVGAMPPFSGPNGVPVVVEESLAEQEDLVFEAGTHREALKMRMEDYLRVASPKVARFARAGERARPKRSSLLWLAGASSIIVAAAGLAASARARRRRRKPLGGVTRLSYDLRERGWGWLLIGVPVLVGALGVLRRFFTQN